jgi:hypothetical protein
MATPPGNSAEARPREWLAMPGGRLRQVVSVPAAASLAGLRPEGCSSQEPSPAGSGAAGSGAAGSGPAGPGLAGSGPAGSGPAGSGLVELVSPAVWMARLAPHCWCGKPCLGSGRTCGAPECVRRLSERESG